MCDRKLVEELGNDFADHVCCGRLLEIARNAAPLEVVDPWQEWRESCRTLRVAMAYDEAFHCYFPDTMDCLERLGAELIDFSPLKSERLPEGIDLVWLGCGHPERFADRLTRNICLRQSLQAYVRDGGRVYAEGGGLAYVCETMVCPGGRYPLAGLLPAEAHFEPTAATAVDVELLGQTWLGRQRVQGYLNPCWRIVPRPSCLDLSACSGSPLSLLGCARVIGSLVHLHFASQPQLLQSIWSAGHSTELA